MLCYNGTENNAGAIEKLGVKEDAVCVVIKTVVEPCVRVYTPRLSETAACGC